MYIIAHGTLVQSVPVMIVKLLYSRLHCNIIYCCKLLHWGILGDAGQRESRVRARRVKARISAQPGYGVCDASPAHYVIFDCEPRRSHDHCRTLLPLFTFAHNRDHHNAWSMIFCCAVCDISDPLLLQQPRKISQSNEKFHAGIGKTMEPKVEFFILFAKFVTIIHYLFLSLRVKNK